MIPGMEPIVNLKPWLKEQERMWIDKAMTISGGNRNVAAHLLGLKRTSLQMKLRYLNLLSKYPPRR